MKIALISFGHVDVALPLYKHLRNLHTNIDLIFCFALDRKSESILNFSDKKINQGFLSDQTVEELIPQGIKKYLGTLSSISFYIYNSQKLRSLNNLLLSIKLAARLKQYDVIHFNGINGVLPVLIFLIRKRQLVFSIHDIHTHTGEKTRHNFAEKLNQYLVKSRHTVIIQNSNDYDNLIIKHPESASKLKLIPFGILDIYKYLADDSVKAPASDLLFFGRISPYKGIEYLIESLEILHSRGIHPKTVIAGEGQVYFDTGKLEELGVQLINRYLPNEELVALIRNTRAVICPYTDATQSGVVMTAFAFNKPVIATSVGSFKEVIIDYRNGFLVPPCDAGILARKIEQLVSSPELIESMAENIKTDFQSGDYSWSTITQKVRSLYSSLFLS
jgi:glycosyltransferase involved in cell wall biosynthesis